MTAQLYGQEYGVGCDGDPVSIFDLMRSMREPWMIQGACRNPGYDPRMWHGEGQTEQDHQRHRCAKRVCHQECPVRWECLEYALANPREIGIWGGLTERERSKYRKARRLLVAS